MIGLRPCETDSDYEAWLAVRRAVLPNERTASLDELRSGIKPGDLHVLAELDGELAGSGLVNRSDTGNAHVAPQGYPIVLPVRHGTRALIAVTNAQYRERSDVRPGGQSTDTAGR